MSDVTGLQVISNLYAGEIKFINTEQSGGSHMISAIGTKNVGNAWIPWCDKLENFEKHHISVATKKKVIYIWQSGPNIRYSYDGWSANAPNIPGNSQVGQSVAWVFDSNGNVTQTSYS